MPRMGLLLGLLVLGCGTGVASDPGARAVDAEPPSVSRPARRGCTRIAWCRELDRPDGAVICETDLDETCSDAERIAECAEDARFVCGLSHARPIHYRPPIAGRATEVVDGGAD